MPAARLAATAIVAGASALIAGPVPLSPAEGCLATESLEVAGVRYEEVTRVHNRVERGTRVGTGVATSCRDQEDAASAARRLTVYRAAGVDARVALVTRDGRLFRGSGFVLEHPAHPLHSAVYGSTKRPNHRRGADCSDTVRQITGTLRRPLLGSVLAIGRRGGRIDAVTIDASTAVVGLRRDGIPYLSTGRALALAVLRCEDGDLVATRIRPRR